jgi:16S rRNA (adenine1518-N6/adenine1519-N6)-dimethyltransferase
MSELPKTNKALGQHWLTDTATLENICDFANITKEDTVLEVGPGVGTLTGHLAKRAGKVFAVEYDDRFALELAATYANTNVEVHSEDILQFDLSKLPKHYKVTANIPYYLTSNLLRVLCESPHHPQSMTLLVQKEVAERVAAKPGDMSVLSVSVQFYCEVHLGEVVPAYLFTPPPKVDSQILRLDYRSKPLFDNVDVEKFFTVVKAGFSERRKKLRSSLSGGLRISKDQAEEFLHKAEINPDKRAQELSLQNWHSLYTVIST